MKEQTHVLIEICEKSYVKASTESLQAMELHQHSTHDCRDTGHLGHVVLAGNAGRAILVSEFGCGHCGLSGVRVPDDLLTLQVSSSHIRSSDGWRVLGTIKACLGDGSGNSWRVTCPIPLHFITTGLPCILAQWWHLHICCIAILTINIFWISIWILGYKHVCI